MKSLLLPLAALLVLASCQPTGRGNSSKTEIQTQTRKESTGPTADRMAVLSTDEEETIKPRFAINTAPKRKQFAAFLKGFPQTSLPLALNSKTHRQIRKDDFISYDYEAYVPEMETEAFSREVGKEFYYLAKVGEGAGYTAVIYAVKNVMAGDNSPYGYILASYNNNGKIIDKLIAGGQIELDEALRVGTIAADGTIEVKEFTRRWAKDPKEEGYYDNKVVGTSLKATKHYRIVESGKIQKEEQLLGMR